MTLASCRTAGLAAAAVLLASAVPAAEIVSARLFTEPEQPFVNQPFTLSLELETTPGCQLEGLTLAGLPDGGAISLPQLTPHPAVPVTRGGEARERHLFTSRGRGLRPLAQTLRPVLGATLVERRSRGFFSNWSTATRQVRLPPLPFTVRELPADGRPEGFAGAVGSFTLRGRIEPREVMPEDLVTLRIEVVGDGHLGEAEPLLPPADPAFKVYPPRLERRETEPRLLLTQVRIPLSTNACTVGEVRLPFFDPTTGGYRVATAGPFTLVFTTRTGEAPTVRHLEPTRPARVPRPTGGADNLQREVRRLLPAAAGLAAALLAAAVVRPRAPRWTLPAALLLFALTSLAAWRLMPRAAPGLPLRAAAALRLAPAASSLPLAELPAGEPVRTLDRHEAWLRVEAGGRRGWIPADALEESRVVPD